MKSCIVIGGGIAGLSAAWALSRHTRVTLLEQESTLGSGSSGKSAAIFRCLDLSKCGAALALRSRVLLDELLGTRERWLKPTGVVYVAHHESALNDLEALGRSLALPLRKIGHTELMDLVPSLEGTQARFALFSPTEGTLCVHEILSALEREAIRHGARIQRNCMVTKICSRGTAITGVEVNARRVISCDAVVIAAGDHANQLGDGCGAALPLQPLGRHLVLLDVDPAAKRPAPVVWNVEDELYFRPESGAQLASACDEHAGPESPEALSHALQSLSEKLCRTAPSLSRGHVKSVWYGLRTFARDRAIVIGADPRRQGLYWFAGLGGHGMSAAVAGGEQLAQIIHGDPSPFSKALGVERLLESDERARRRARAAARP